MIQVNANSIQYCFSYPANCSNSQNIHDFAELELFSMKLPVVLFLQGSSVPDMFYKVALHFEKDFHWAVFYNATRDQREDFHVASFPEVHLFVPQEDKTNSSRKFFAVVQYDPDQFGPLNVQNLYRLVCVVGSARGCV
jgi:hypothetical protein